MSPRRTTPLFAATLLAALALLLGAAPLAAQTRYGDARVEQGSMTLVRGQEKFRYEQGQPLVVVSFGDTIVVHDKSRVLLDTVEGAKVTIGANAAFQVKPFKQRESLGALRLLFGRVRAAIAGLREDQQFSIKTAQAVIGVKGTEFVASVTAQGDTLVVVDETTHIVSLTGLEGPQRELTPNLMAAVVNSKPVSEVALVGVEERKALALENLASPAAFQPEAKSLRGEEVLVRTGIVSEKDLVEARRDRATLQDAIRFEEQAPPLRQRYELSPDSARPFLRFRLYLREAP